MKNLFFIFLLLFGALVSNGQIQTNWQVHTHDYAYVNGAVNTNLKLKSNVVYDISEDKNGDMWFSVFGKGIARFTGTKYTWIKPSKQKVYSPKIFASAFDSKGHLWIGTNKGILKFDGLAWTGFDPDDTEGFDVNRVREICIGPDDKVYVTGRSARTALAGGSGLSVFDGSKWQHFDRTNMGIDEDYFSDLCFDDNGNLYMAAGTNGNGIVKYDGNTFKHITPSNSDLEGFKVRAITKDSEGKMWFGTNRGLSVYDGTNWEVVKLESFSIGKKNFEKLNKWMAQPDISSLALQSNGVIWVGTRDDGVYRLTKENIEHLTPENSALTSLNIRKITIDSRDRVWFMTGKENENVADFFLDDQGGFMGVVKYEGYDYGQYPNWIHFNQLNSNLSGGSNKDIVVDNEGTIWASNSIGGLNKLVSEDTWEEIPFERKGLLTTLSQIEADEKGNIWGAMTKQGLMKYDGSEPVYYNKDNTNIPNNNVGVVRPDGKGGVWVGTYKGLAHFNGSEFTLYDKKSIENMPSNFINAIEIDSKGNLWVGTSKGAVKYDGSNWSLMTKKTGLVGNQINGIAEDKDGNIWLASGFGLNRIDPTGKITASVKTREVGLSGSINTITSDVEGNIWLGVANNGLAKFDGSSWSYFNHTNSGILYDNVTALHCTHDGLLIGLAKRVGTKSTSSAPVSSAPSSLSKLSKLTGSTETAKAIVGESVVSGINAFEPYNTIFIVELNSLKN